MEGGGLCFPLYVTQPCDAAGAAVSSPVGCCHVKADTIEKTNQRGSGGGAGDSAP